MQSDNSRLLFGSNWLSLRRCGAIVLIILALSFTTIFGILLVVAVGTTVATSAKAAEIRTSAVISHRDLDLSNPADVALLKRRVDRAARRICTPEGIERFAAHSKISSCAAAASDGGHLRIAEVVAAQGRLTQASR